MMPTYAELSIEDINAAHSLLEAAMGDDPNSVRWQGQPLRNVWAALAAIINDTDYIRLSGRGSGTRRIGTNAEFDVLQISFVDANKEKLALEHAIRNMRSVYGPIHDIISEIIESEDRCASFNEHVQDLSERLRDCASSIPLEITDNP